MQYAEFMEQVTRKLDASDADGVRGAVDAVLKTLGECLTGGEADDLASQLPTELKDPLTGQSEDAKPLSMEQFHQRVSEQEGVELERAAAHTAAVMKVLSKAATEGELEDARSQLPDELGTLLQESSR